MGRYRSRVYSPKALQDMVAAASYLLQDEKDLEIKAEWLLEGGLNSAIWKTANGKKHFYDGEKWQKTKNINFQIVLPDGSSLLDEKNHIILHDLQSWAFGLRAGFFGFNPGPSYWHTLVQWGLDLTCWIFLNKLQFNPEVEGYAKLTKNHLMTLMGRLAEGSWDSALKVIPRTLTALYRLAFNSEIPPNLLQDPYNLPEPVKQKIIDELIARHAYSPHSCTTDTQTGIVSRTFICSLIGRTSPTLRNVKFKLFMRQFEPALQKSLLLIPAHTAGISSQRVKLLDEITLEGISKQSLHAHVINANHFFSGYFDGITSIPKLEISIHEVLAHHGSSLQQSKHQALMPLTFGLELLGQAMKWVTVYGQALVEATLEFVARSEDHKLTPRTYAEKRKFEDQCLQLVTSKYSIAQYDETSPATIGQALNITRCNRRNHRTLDKHNPTLHQALYILIGACITCIGLLKPSREEELTSLKRRCLFTDTLTNGAWLESMRGKAGLHGNNPDSVRPIPYAAAKAVMLLQMLGENLSRIFDDNSKHADDLFYFPSQSKFSRPGDSTMRGRIRICVDFLSDYIETPIDEHGRRYYPRIHEMRKFFLLVLHWHEKDYGLDCGAWMAAHRDPSHIAAYTEAVDTVEEISEWEAQCVDEKLIALEETQSIIDEAPGLVELYKRVCKKFNVTKIKGLDKKNYYKFLMRLRDRNEFEIKPFLIYGKNGIDPVGFDFIILCKENINGKRQH